ncbi:alpha-1,6-mannosyltransferase [Pichia kluyveri]|uniref:Alpha-1,6-mannosyltransferase n=1 Tax=Pichia kluyveri TaxID=36015 RepID=A0AAV5QYP6_PICKL|nr:alpha-1,6-mannosyltransferase [Pichia kluyveri]
MESNPDLLYRKKRKSFNGLDSLYSKTIQKFKLNVQKYFGIDLDSNYNYNSKFNLPVIITDYLPIVILLLILNYLINGNIIPKPFTTSIGNHSPPENFFKFTQSKFLGSYNLHGLTSKSTSFIPVTDKYIFPRVQDINTLKELSYEDFFDVETYGNPKNPKSFYKYSLDFYEDIDEDEEIINIDKDQNEKAVKNSEIKPKYSLSQQNAMKSFKQTGRKIYKGNENPEIILVTSINFENLNPSYIVKIIQNRVDYAHTNNYGVYSRWNQEFLPMFQKTRNSLDSWSRIIAIREAMIAFPKAKWFWYIDETSFIMNNQININNYILKKESLEPIILKDQSILQPDGFIKTYSDVKFEDISIILTQNENGISVDNFIIKNNLYGKAILNLVLDPLMKTYPKFKKDVSTTLSHILQWHPILLSKTVIIPPRTINARVNNNADIDIKYAYQNDDFVISFANCKLLANCEKQLTPYWEKTQLKNKDD